MLIGRQTQTLDLGPKPGKYHLATHTGWEFLLINTNRPETQKTSFMGNLVGSISVRATSEFPGECLF